MINDKILDVICSHLKSPEKNTLAFTGAGISCECNIPAFRGPGGLWSKYRPEIYASAAGIKALLKNKPADFISFIKHAASCLLEAEPGSSHKLLAEFEAGLNLAAVITQNIDNLHQAAGTKNVCELHGNIYRAVCLSCGRIRRVEKQKLKNMIASLSPDLSGGKLLKKIKEVYPECSCGGYFRPDVVLFGEMLDSRVLEKCEALVRQCSLMLILGTSSLVYPAASMPLIAKEHGALIVDINPADTALDGIADYCLKLDSAEALKCIKEHLS